MPRVVVLNDHVTPYRLGLFRRLSQSVDLTVLYNTRRLPEYYWNIPEPLGFPHKVLPGWVIRLKRPPYDDPRFIFINPTLLFELIRLRPEIVVGYAYSFSCWAALLYCKLFGAKFISWSNETQFTERYLSQTQQRIRAWIIPQAAACITASQQGREKFLHYGADPSRIFIVGQGSDREDFSDVVCDLRAEHHTYADEYGLTGRIILYVGLLITRKGVSRLLDVFPDIRSAIPDARLLIVGEGPAHQQLAAQAQRLRMSEYVHFAGFIQPDAIASVYASGDVFVLPSLEDSYAAVVAEAVASGLPVVGSCYAAATAELVHEDENGHIVSPNHRTELIAAIIDVLSDEQRRQRMSAASLAISQQNTIAAASDAFLKAIHLAACPDQS